MIYGSTPIGGTNGTGTVYSLTTNGANFRVVRSLPASGVSESGPHLRGLLCSGGTIFGSTTVGGTNLSGTIFSLNTNGTSFTILYNFSTNVNNTNFDGADPEGALILVGDTLYGAASAGGAHGNGTVFSVNTNGSGFSTLWSFSKLNSARMLMAPVPARVSCWVERIFLGRGITGVQTTTALFLVLAWHRSFPV
jgi:uncharacterized repeat protein (TIGR03803 family)